MTARAIAIRPACLVGLMLPIFLACAGGRPADHPRPRGMKPAYQVMPEKASPPSARPAAAAQQEPLPVYSFALELPASATPPAVSAPAPAPLPASLAVPSSPRAPPAVLL